MYSKYHLATLPTLLLRVLLAWLLWCSSVMAQPPQQQEAKIIMLDQAISLVEQAGRVERVLVSLPFEWDKQPSAQAGRAELEIAFDLPGEPSEPHALFMAQLGNRFEIWLNGTLISRGGNSQQSDMGKAPHFVAVPPSLLQKSNLFRLKMEADALRGAAVSPLLFGLEQPVRQAYEQAYGQQVSAVLAVATLMAVLAVVCLALWVTQPASWVSSAGQSTEPAKGTRQRDALYLYTACIAFLLAWVLSDRLVDTPPLPWPAWAGILKTALALIVLLSAVSYGYLRKEKSAGIHSLALGLPWLMLIWAAAALLAMPSRFAGLSWQAHSFWLLLIPVLYALVMFYTVVTRFRSASAQARDLMQTLQARVAQREQELALSYDKLEQLAREQERSQERTRILRDMHDGAGAHISAALRQVEGGHASSPELKQTLQDAQDQLKLSIDAMHLQPGDVSTLLANLRYRLGKRFEKSGINVMWEVEALPPLPELDSSAMHQLQSMMFEAFSNVLQHSNASTLRVQAEQVGHQVQISVIDNGRGFDAAQPSRGLASMRERAKAIGALLDIQSQAGQTAVHIWLGKAASTGA